MSHIKVGEYLLIRLREMGVEHAFGVAGDFVLGLDQLITKTNHIQFVATCNELNAAYAADGYARIKGIGCFISTYAVGELSALNGIAGAYAEHIPLIVVTGSPTREAHRQQPLLHHTLGDYKKPYKIMKQVTIAQTLLNDPKRAPKEIDRVLRACFNQQRPVYISLPSDMVNEECEPPSSPLPLSNRFPEGSDKGSLTEAVEEAASLLNASERPIVLADVQVLRYQLEKEVEHLLEQSGLPFSTLLMGKALLNEDHPQFIGLYSGRNSHPDIRARFKNSDCILRLGIWLSDLNTGSFSVDLPADKSIDVHTTFIKIKNHYYHRVSMKDFLEELTKKLKKRDPNALNKMVGILPAYKGYRHRPDPDFKRHIRPEQQINSKCFYNRIANFLPKNSIVIAETGSALFSIAETQLPRGATFIGQIFYGSIGFTLGAALGAAVAAPKRKVVLFIGDGSFQEAAQDLSTFLRCKLNNVIVFLINNDGYSIERAIVDGSFNDIQPWKYHLLPLVFDGTKGFDVKTEKDLEEALMQAEEEKFAFIEVHFERMDVPDSMKRAGESMRKKNKIPSA